jgi:hypothetical protein
MDRDKEIIELFINKNFVSDISKSTKISLKELYNRYKLWASPLNFYIGKHNFSKYMNDLGYQTYNMGGYVKSYKLINKSIREKLTDDEILKYN